MHEFYKSLSIIYIMDISNENLNYVCVGPYTPLTALTQSESCLWNCKYIFMLKVLQMFKKFKIYIFYRKNFRIPYYFTCHTRFRTFCLPPKF